MKLEEMIRCDTLVEQDITLSRLNIQPGGSLHAPEGKFLTLTVNGVGQPIEPGTYEGDVRLSVRDNFTRSSLRFGQETISDFRAGVCVNDGKVLENCSVSPVVQGGEVTDSYARSVSIASNEWDFNGFYITGESDYEIDDSKITLTGDGTDDFVGLGAGIAAAGNAKVHVKNTEIRTYGITRGTVFVGGNAQVKLEDCRLSTESYVPSPAQLTEGIKLERMMEPPWSIGLKGNGRATNLAGHGRLSLERCHVSSNSWGVLSVDGAIVNRLNVKDSLIEITGENGYGCFSICDDFLFDYKSFGDYGCYDTIDHSTFNVPYTGILMSLGNAAGEFKNGSVVNSGRFGAFIHRNSGGMLRINSGAAFRTGSSCVVVKGSNTNFEFDSAILEPGNGTILQLMDNDDVGMCSDPFLIPVGEADIRDPQRDLSTADPEEDVFVTVSNMEAKGNFYNSTTNLMACTRRLPKPAPSPDDPPELPPPEIPIGPDGKPVLRGFVGEDLMGAKNLEMKLVNAAVIGIISAATASYKPGLTRICAENRQELSNITQTAAEPVNNGVILSLDGSSRWVVTGTSYLTRLSLAEGAQIESANGKALRLTVNGKEEALHPGTYTGQICLSVE